MSVLGTLEGTGTLLVLGQRFDDIPYNVVVTQSRQLKQASGTVTFPSISVGMTAFEAGSAVLQLRGGKTIDIIVTRFSPPNMEAEIVVSGAVPGY